MKNKTRFLHDCKRTVRRGFAKCVLTPLDLFFKKLNYAQNNTNLLRMECVEWIHAFNI